MAGTYPWDNAAFPVNLAEQAGMTRKAETQRRYQDGLILQNFEHSGYVAKGEWRCPGTETGAHHWLAQGRTWHCRGCPEVRSIAQEGGQFYSVGRSAAARHRRNREQVA